MTENTRKITVDINNQQIMSLSQEAHDSNLILTTELNGTTVGEWVISPGDFVMLMNYYRNRKQNRQPIF